MRISMRAVSTAISTGVLLLSAPVIDANEGMWLFNNPPRKILKEQYGFEPRSSGSSTCRSRRSASTAAAPARSSRRTAW